MDTRPIAGRDDAPFVLLTPPLHLASDALPSQSGPIIAQRHMESRVLHQRIHGSFLSASEEHIVPASKGGSSF